MVHQTDKVRVDFAGPAQTMLATLYAKALDAAADNPIVGDTHAQELVRRLDYDWRRMAITATNKRAFSVTMRAAHFDAWGAPVPRCASRGDSAASRVRIR